MEIQRTIPELLMPAGGFDSAVASMEGGADALYLGFSEFSARMQARNFDRLEYRRLRRLARERGLKLYVTLNTIIMEAEIEALSSLLAFLGRFPPDAVLVQDWGLAALIRERHPGIAIHASTQAAVQGISAARIAKELGAVRIVLPRETSLAEMARLREEEPGLEYEAFVHGALCYSFSGLCLASGLVLGRSGNRGECAQLCRSYYDEEGREVQGFAAMRSGKGGRGYYFSCRDLELGDRVAELAEAGICSLKVEGRMKGPEYCYAVARLYRGILDRMKGSGPDDAELEARRRAARTAFSRSPTEAWLFEKGGASLVDAEYPGHRGLRAGRIVSVSPARLVLDLESDLGLRDGLLGFEEDDPFKPLRFSATKLRDPRHGRELFKAKSGDRIELDAPLVEGRPSRLRAGAELSRISARDMDRRAPSQEEYEPEREELRLRLHVAGRRLCAELELPDFKGRRYGNGGSGNFVGIEGGDELPLDRAKSVGGFARALSVFSESGGGDILLAPEFEPGEEIELPPGPDARSRGCAMGELFIPPSVLKREKNRIYARAASLVSEAELAYARESSSLKDRAMGPGRAVDDIQEPFAAPPRSALVFPRPDLPSGMPFATRRDLVEGRALPSWDGRLWLPLAPLVSDREEYGGLVLARVKKELDAGNRVSMGIGALHHFALAREALHGLASQRAGEEGRLSFFLDFNLYVASYLAFASLSSLLPRIEFAYRYIEAEASEKLAGDAVKAPLVPIGDGFEPPLFQSLGCALKHHVEGGACPPRCARGWSTLLRDRDRRYRLFVEDCVTMLFRDSGGVSGSA